ncbi:MAG TPA: hypothetical protein VFB27_02755 [Opitutaceae bacterium]|nr:hypothetical protein [Opitutaceae bacterium]
MLSQKSSTQLKIIGIEGLNADSIRQQVAHGAKFVIYSYNFSLVVMSFKRASNVYFVRAGQSRVLKGLPFTLISLLFGWWGIPHGVIFTIQTLATNLGGGRDVTDAVVASLLPAPAPASATATSSTSASPSAPPSASPKPSLYALAIGVIAAIAAIIYAGVCTYKGRNLPVVLVSGLPEAYDVSLNGQTYHLRYHAPQLLNLPEGAFTLQARLPGGRKVDEHLAFATDFFSRPFHPRVAVLNPDKAAVVYIETTQYHPTGSTIPGKEENDFDIYINQTGYFLERPDYVLANFPATISMPEGTDSVSKTRLDVFRDLGPDEAAPLVEKKAGYASMRVYLENLVRLDANDESALGEIITALHPPDALALLQARLAERPVHLELHRYYQSLMESQHSDFDLAGQYQRWSDAEPDNGDLVYLRARLVEDRDTARPLFERALAAPHSCLYAAVALGSDEIVDANFQRGLDLLLQAENGGVHSETLQLYKRAALLGLGRTEDVAKAVKAELAAAPLNIELFADLLRLEQSMAPDRTGGELTIKQFLAEFRQRYGNHDDLAKLDNYLHASLAYGAGDEAEFARRARQLTGAENAFESAVSRRDHATAAAALGHADKASARYYWILYLTAWSTGDQPAADAYFQKGLAALEKEGRRGQELARRIRSGTPADEAEILRTSNYVLDNCVLFTALGLHAPAQRGVYFERARRFDVDPSFPHLLLRSLLATKPTLTQG